MNKISSAESSRLVVTYRPVGDLIPDPRNARTHPKRQIDQIKASHAELAFVCPDYSQGTKRNGPSAGAIALRPL